MSDKTQELAARWTRNFDGVELKHFVRGSVYESHGGRLSEGTAAKKLAAGVDTVPPGKRSCP